MQFSKIQPFFPHLIEAIFQVVLYTKNGRMGMTVRASGSVSLPLEYNCRPSWIYTFCYHHIWHELKIIITILQRQWCFIISASIHMICIFIQASEWMDGEMHSSLLYGHIEIIKKIPHFIPFDWEENLPFEGNVVSMHPADCRRRIALSRKQY